MNRLMTLIKKISELIKKKYAKLRILLRNSFIYNVYYHKPIDENMVFLTSRDGMDFTGNIFRIAQELSKQEYRHLKLYAFARPGVEHKIQSLVRQYNLAPVKTVTKFSRIVAAMERAKYIISDSGIPFEYVKRDGQVVLNTWHGTPFKTMGRSEESAKHTIGTVQHLFLSSDYLLYPSEYMRDCMLKDYMVENVISGEVILDGYPRNSIFFDGKYRAELSRKLGFEGKKVYAYMPTHRGQHQKPRHGEQVNSVVDYLCDIDAQMQPDQLLLVKLHVFNQSQIDFTQFEHIVPFPEGYETYDVLNCADCLITDYSSVFFDYANTRKKIILFAYDEEVYMAERGTYFPFSSLPFPKVATITDLIREMNSEKNYDDTEFLKTYCPYDCFDATERLCRFIFKSEPVCKAEKAGNGKENVLIYGGSLRKNGITASLLNLLNSIDKDKRNYYVSFRRAEINSDPQLVNVISDDVDYLPIMSEPVMTLREKIAYKKYCKNQDVKKPLPDILKRLFAREKNRCYYGANFSHVIQFDGYRINTSLLFDAFNTSKTIFVHNDMVRELAERPWLQHAPTLYYLYNNYDNVAVVSEDLIKSTMACGAPAGRIKLVTNIQNADLILAKAKQDIKFEKDTICTTAHPGGISGVLQEQGKKFINIGRFSAEKGHMRLMEAFDCFCNDYPDAKLIIIGGLGNLYDETLKRRNKMKHWKNVTIIKSMSNPMPVLKECDLFCLPSFYEGLPMTLFEADILDVPLYSTAIAGPRLFLEKHDGYIVENTVDGVLQGMYDYMDGKINTLTIDYAAYKENAIREFESLFGGKSV